ncbi:MAG TPA: hybrid sensor histidine kinase/response regulator [Gammaproteobacteria bacterium]|jgi:signal transduction histidine kinase|nr:hybrid sensor histidine kinase/response regulator [Acidiferrobacteraceae bacterium]MDP6791141.1 PAS-domain containing protein [Arenicellales bacterium]MDP6918859.1 PAS-domain containing protein [Arenicellales bacterium]HCX86921.1 hybrid sensor histidine kinase/response regulator [Gammaproteobacteria bacterium]|tara:strand:+ start:4515 stop:6194 length:1680 start_codon:yes stop_codon:yes gene_type:complete
MGSDRDSLLTRAILTLDALDHLDQGVSVFDQSLQLISWNRYFTQMLEFPEEFARIGTPLETLFAYNARRGDYGPGDPDQQVQERMALARQFVPHHFERTRPSGQVLEIRGTPLQSGGFVTIYTDITDRKRAEQALRNSHDLLEQRVTERTTELHQANAALREEIAQHKNAQAALLESQKLNALGQLTSGIAHDFNNLLTIIQGNLDLIGDSPQPNTATRESLRAAASASRRGAELTRQLLDFSSHQTLSPAAVRPTRLFADLDAMLKRTLSETIEVEITPGRNTWSTRADPVRLENAIVNLALNARDAMPQGGQLTISAANVSLKQYDERIALGPGDFVMYSIEDNGEGMSAAVIERAFEPFFTTKGVGTGTGLGLSTVYGFVRQSGGQVHITSRSGVGTRVEFYLPRATGNEGEPLQDKSQDAPMGHGERILVVENDQNVRGFICRVLDDLGYQTLDASGGQQAQELAERHRDLDLLLTDLLMPGGIDGESLCRQLKKTHPHIQTLCISGQSSDMINSRSGHFPTTTLAKPFSARQLGNAVHKALNLSGTESHQSDRT